MVVVGGELSFNLVAIGQTPGLPRVFAIDDGRVCERFERTQRDVAEVPDGRRDEVQAGLGRLYRSEIETQGWFTY